MTLEHTERTYARELQLSVGEMCVNERREVSIEIPCILGASGNIEESCLQGQPALFPNLKFWEKRG